MLARGSGVEKSVLRYVRTKWIAPNKCCGILFVCISQAKDTKASPPARKLSLFFSIIFTIILSYAIIRIYTILHIYLQVSETERLAELQWVIELSVLEKINPIYFQGISLKLSKMFFQESECAFKNLNVLNIEASNLHFLFESPQKNVFDFLKRNS